MVSISGLEKLRKESFVEYTSTTDGKGRHIQIGVNTLAMYEVIVDGERDKWVYGDPQNAIRRYNKFLNI